MPLPGGKALGDELSTALKKHKTKLRRISA